MDFSTTFPLHTSSTSKGIQVLALTAGISIRG